MPKLWNDTIDAHHEAVGDAIFAATASIISGEGFAALSMARIAQQAGIGRATLYKYFSDLDAVLAAWHERVVSQHLQMVESIAASHDDPSDALRHTLVAYGNMSRRTPDHSHAGVLHNLSHVTKSHDHLHAHVRKLMQEAVKSGSVRRDIPADELAGFALAAIDNARSAKSERGVERTVDLILRAVSS